jgi:hypothetical protein
MANLNNLEGVYIYSHPFLINGNFNLEIVVYDNPKNNLASKGIYNNCPINGRVFISSLFPVKRKDYQKPTTGIYSFDFDNINYLLFLDKTNPNQMEIQRIGIKDKSKSKPRYNQRSFF